MAVQIKEVTNKKDLTNVYSVSPDTLYRKVRIGFPHYFLMITILYEKTKIRLLNVVKLDIGWLIKMGILSDESQGFSITAI